MTFQDSPVEVIRKQLPRGDAKWSAFAHVYCNLSKAAEKMGASSYRGNEFHVLTMAIMGTGHEETMKAHQQLLYIYNWL